MWQIMQYQASTNANAEAKRMLLKYAYASVHQDHFRVNRLQESRNHVLW